MIYLMLFYEFFKTGLFSIGGGLATLPFLYDMATRTGWFTINDITDMIAISQSTPGPLGINMAAYAGYLTAGTAGAFVATTGLVFPSLVIIVMISKMLEKLKGNRWVEAFFRGLRPASFALIAVAWLRVVQIAYIVRLQAGTAEQGTILLVKRLALAAVLLFILKKWKPHPIVLIGIGIIVSFFVRFL